MEVLSWLIGVLSLVVIVFGFVPVLVGSKLMEKYSGHEGVLGKIVKWMMPVGLVLTVILLPIFILCGFTLFFMMLF